MVAENQFYSCKGFLTCQNFSESFANLGLLDELSEVFTHPFPKSSCLINSAKWSLLFSNM